MTLPPPPSVEEEPTFADAEEELGWMLDCIAIETRIRAALRYQERGVVDDEEDEAVEEVPAESGEFVAAGAILPWGRYLPPSSC